MSTSTLTNVTSSWSAAGYSGMMSRSALGREVALHCKRGVSAKRLAWLDRDAVGSG